MWFRDLFGFDEITPQQVQSLLQLQENKLTSSVNGASYHTGNFSVISLQELRNSSRKLILKEGCISVSEVVADVMALHQSEEANHALFQVASQFNCLEMISPTVTPSHGVGIYQFDTTQGPRCAIACGAATVYRNYFYPIGSSTGQTEGRQINCLDAMGKQLGNNDNQLWNMENGYALITPTGQDAIYHTLQNMNKDQLDILRSSLCVGFVQNAQVTAGNRRNHVSQVFCSALPLRYFPHSDKIHAFAQLILDATYEATFHAALLNVANTGNPRVYLTLVGGSAFANDVQWILASIRKCILAFRKWPLDIRIVSYGQPNPRVKQMIEEVSVPG